jgi:hypothetical protein
MQRRNTTYSLHFSLLVRSQNCIQSPVPSTKTLQLLYSFQLKCPLVGKFWWFIALTVFSLSLICIFSLWMWQCWIGKQCLWYNVWSLSMQDKYWRWHVQQVQGWNIQFGCQEPTRMSTVFWLWPWYTVHFSSRIRCRQHHYSFHWYVVGDQWIHSKSRIISILWFSRFSLKNFPGFPGR